ncbi:DUF1800 domain-containing protein [Sinirhodobacter ferrireducens]|uniref:DUF1800 domain-containing protein n=1 Tax=Paenirhodobacter ferrireducens TaxID=1215032 RepID=A0A443LAW4_9RHOB|nr:DUF1800 domain-containing protein [Sinirhodobacter ferrireducens]RWR46296.1 DUF1800 domain-containing protein [Sinirhodobacter ferrireducens]
MEFSTLAPVRFGFGLSPRQTPPASPDEILAALRGPDLLAQRWPGLTTQEALQMRDEFLRLRKAEAQNVPGATEDFKRQRQAIDRSNVGGLQIALARAVEDPTGMRERLHAFWRNHFTVRAKRTPEAPLATAHGEALRPEITGSFPALLRASTLHPMMLIYLDQIASFGPDSKRAKKRPDLKLGLNENLARELMELHTLGVGGSYTQDDVRQLAELLTGLRVMAEEGTTFAPDFAEPGAETVLGHAYGGDPAKMADIVQVLTALALHPDTSRHIATKLAVHFVGPEPDPALTGAMSEAYLGAKGQLLPVYEVLLTHPAAQGGGFLKVRQPFDYIATGVRAMGFDGKAVMAFNGPQIRRHAFKPLRDMGQRWLGAPAPNGWPEAAEEWISPQQLAARINWALKAPAGLQAKLPEPADFARAALGPRLSDLVAQAVPRSESRPEAAALVLASAEMNRR